MSHISNNESPCGRDIYEGSLSGAQDRPFIPRLRSDPPSFHPLSRTLEDFRSSEGQDEREQRLRALFKKLPRRRKHAGNTRPAGAVPSSSTEILSLTKEKAERLTEIYEEELRKRCAEESVETISWSEFKRYADNKEAGK